MTTTLGILAPSLSPGAEAMFDVLGRALGVSFERRRLGDDRNLDGWIILSADRMVVDAFRGARQPCYIVLNDAELVQGGRSSSITFGNHSHLAPVLRGRDVTADDAITAKILPDWFPLAVPLAFKSGAAVWAVQEQVNCRHHYVSLPPPDIAHQEPLFTYFSGQRIACLLPLIVFVRSLSKERWTAPPLQATFMFDDPNLHWRSYGFIDYNEMVRHAVAGKYHVCVATIPLDAWLVHKPTSAIFRDNTARISLLYHGNNHVFRELARSHSADSMRALLLQAGRRMTKMEARTGLKVARVMAPPHGACSETALAQMAQIGFEAACVSRGSLRYHNSGAQWTRTIGMNPCDIIAGLPVIPRCGLSRSCRNDILIAALLHQPIVVMTHHLALAEGYDLLDETASFVNSLGEVTWSDMETISRSLYLRRQVNSTFCVSMFGKRASIQVPLGSTHVQVEGPALDGSPGETLFWRAVSEDLSWKVLSRSQAFAVKPGAMIEIAFQSTLSSPSKTYGSRRQSALLPFARRLLTEARDRALPPIRLLTRQGAANRST